MQSSPCLWQGQQNILGQGQLFWPSSKKCIFPDVMVYGQITTIHSLSKMSTKLGQPTTHWGDWDFVTDIWVRPVEQSPNMLNMAPSTIVIVQVEDAQQYFVDRPQVDTMPVLPSAQAFPGTETIFLR